MYESSFNNFGSGNNNSNKPSNLFQTKLFLRDQLKEMKQLEQAAENGAAPGKSTARTTDQTETESCVETRVVNRDTILSRYESSMSTLTRPTSSPSKYDTKTKIKGKPQEFKNKYVLEKDENISRGGDLSTTAVKLQTQTLVSKVFETEETSLQTNTNMYPMHVKSKLPNPKIVRPQTVPENNRELEPHKTRVSRPKTAYESDLQQNAIPPFLMGPKLQVRASRKKKLSENGAELKESNKLASHDNLHLMTYKDVDRIVDTINGYYLDSSSQTQEVKKADFYKKIWMLKSTGQYHGSLLAKPCMRAPEIRE